MQDTWHDQIAWSELQQVTSQQLLLEMSLHTVDNLTTCVSSSHLLVGGWQLVVKGAVLVHVGPSSLSMVVLVVQAGLLHTLLHLDA